LLTVVLSPDESVDSSSSSQPVNEKHISPASNNASTALVHLCLIPTTPFSNFSRSSQNVTLPFYLFYSFSRRTVNIFGFIFTFLFNLSLRVAFFSAVL
jgi:hypothetical protein